MKKRARARGIRPTKPNRVVRARALRACAAWNAPTKMLDAETVNQIIEGVMELGRDATLWHLAGLDALDDGVKQWAQFTLQYLTALGSKFIPDVIETSSAFEQALDLIADHLPLLLHLAFEPPDDVVQEVVQEREQNAIRNSLEGVVSGMRLVYNFLRQNGTQLKQKLQSKRGEHKAMPTREQVVVKANLMGVPRRKTKAADWLSDAKRAQEYVGRIGQTR